MPYFHSRLTVCQSPNTILWPIMGPALEHAHFQPITLQTNHTLCSLKREFPADSSVPRFPKDHCFQTLWAGDKNSCFQPCNYDLPEMRSLNGEVQSNGCDDSADGCDGPKEKRRRRKRKHGNKGKVPWNKGIKHSAETRALIKQRTVEALRDPQVRKKMSEHPRPHSDENKAKIRSSLRQIWDKRLKWKRLREKFFVSWALSIAKAARKGGIDQQELDWDSYDKLEEEFTVQQLDCTPDKAKRKELIVEITAKEKAEKWAMLVRKQKQREGKTKAKIKRKSCRKSNKNTEETLAAEAFTLKQRLTKIRQKKAMEWRSINYGEALMSLSPAWEKLDRELMRKDVHNEVSLADQIRAAKYRRAESMAWSTSISQSSAACSSAGR